MIVSYAGIHYQVQEMTKQRTNRVLVIGAGAAGYFGAISLAEQSPKTEVHLAEASGVPLKKVAISGGGRCNVTHACFDAQLLANAYPRGSKELRGPLSKFQPRDTIEWFESRGVPLKTERDGRVFPRSDTSQSIIDCLESQRKALGIRLRLNTKVTQLNTQKSALMGPSSSTNWEDFDAVLIATGGTKIGYTMAASLGHTIEPLAPSLFTFQVNDNRLKGLSGLSVPQSKLKLLLEDRKSLKDTGPLLITHWGLSGPTVIRLSAWAARELLKSGYKAKLLVTWTAEAPAAFDAQIQENRLQHPKRSISKHPMLAIPKRLWTSLVEAAGLPNSHTYADLSKAETTALKDQLYDSAFSITGKGVFKEEFVTCGGVSLREVDMRTMQSKIVPGIYFAGEVLDIDGITGGFNFQNAWTGSFLAGKAIAQSLAAAEPA
jgi:predicted Rossmann fold flavoprotein